MCGIAGIVYADRAHPVEEALLHRMAAVMSHRGPDAERFHVSAGVGLASRRLRIIDVLTGDQPIYNEDGTKAVVLNGEIYNFRELRSELQAHGHRFRSRSDTESIVHAYEQWGVGCVERLRGMFAFALWDDTQGRLLLARDRVGKKPLYYTEDAARFCFASELKALLQNPSRQPVVNLRAVNDYLSLGAVQPPASIVEGFRQLPPAHYLLWERGVVRVFEYWNVPQEPAGLRREDEALEAFDEVFSDAVRVRLVSDVPVGAFLSGGVDSSAVVAAMARLSAHPPITMTVGFADPRLSELPYASRVAKHVGSEHHEVIVEARAADVLPRLAWHLDEPFADSSAVPTYYLAKAARQRVTVALSGDGGDEVFAGYQRRYGLNRWERRFRRALPTWARTGLVAPLGAIYPKTDWMPRPLRAKYFLLNVGMTFERAYFNDVSVFRDHDRARLLAPDLLRQLDGHDPFTAFGGHFARVSRLDPLNQLLYVDLKTWLANDILVKVDRMSMAHSLEVRSPLLDHKVIEFAAGVATDLKYRGRTSKYLLKRHLQRTAAGAVVDRPKRGFEIPVAEWLRGDLSEMAYELLLSRRSLARGYVRPEAVRRMWHQHQRRIRDRASGLWALMMLELWHRTFMDQDPARGPLAA